MIFESSYYNTKNLGGFIEIDRNKVFFIIQIIIKLLVISYQKME
jgi:hypothetical protein